MSKPENWKQGGPLGDDDWAVAFLMTHEGRAAYVEIEGGDTLVGLAHATHLRAFARALDRAADALEAAAEPEPAPVTPPPSAQVIDIMGALKESLRVAGSPKKGKD